MTTRVVNLRRDPYDVYVGRAGHGHNGYFGNPCAAGRTCVVCGGVHDAGGDTLVCFERYFDERIARDPEFKDRVLDLAGKTLGCFCKPKPCHGDIIAAWIDGLVPKTDGRQGVLKLL